MRNRFALWWWWKRRHRNVTPATALMTEAGAAWTFTSTDDYILWS